MGLIPQVKKLLAKLRAALQKFVTEEVKHQAEEKVKKEGRAKVEAVKTKAKARAKKKIAEKLDGAA